MSIKGNLGHPVLTMTSGANLTIHSGFANILKHFSTSIPIDAQPPVALPLVFGLGQNYPNPFNPTTVIPFTLDRAGDASLEIFNLLGQQVRSFDFVGLSAGQYEVTWDGQSQSGATVPSGQYFMRLSHDARAQVRKLTLLK